MFRSCPSHSIHEQYQSQHNKYAELLRKTKTTHWNEWLKENSSIWQASRFIATPPTDAAKSHILTLQVKDPVTKQTKKETISNKNKGDLLLETFFPPANPNVPQPEYQLQILPPQDGPSLTLQTNKSPGLSTNSSCTKPRDKVQSPTHSLKTLNTFWYHLLDHCSEPHNI